MPLLPGTRLGPYEIVSALGAGGMGEVYRGRDTQLNRDVAIKVLPDLFAIDQERLARFTREAQTLAALNHPNIAQIHGLENSAIPGGTRALVMELVDGEDLSAVIARGPLPPAEAVQIARQMAEALEAAHELGIIHRDLKPANIRVRADGTVKVLDFGLAKALDLGGSQSQGGATVTSPAMTQMGVILGTAAYMSPEQARGKSVDRRADIWAFGVVLYEMLSGSRPFDGETMTDALSAIVSREPDWNALPPDARRHAGPLIRRCLEKDPRRRLQSIGEARIALDSPAAPPEVVAPGHGIRAGSVALLVLGALAAGALGTWALTRGAPPPPAREVRLSMPIGPVPTLAGAFVLSPDGTQLAFVGQRTGTNHIFLRPLAKDESTIVPGTEGVGLVGPAFSPDGRWLVFHSTGTLKKVPVDGGPAVILAEAAAGTSSRPAWGPDGTIVFSNESRGLSSISETGGALRVLTTLEPTRAEVSHEMPWFLWDGKTLLFSVRRGTTAGATTIVSLNLATQERRELFAGAVLGMVGDDQLIVSRESTVLSIPFDTGTLQARGEARSLLTDIVSANRGLFSAIAQFTIARNGTAVYVAAAGTDQVPAMMLTDRSGSAVRITAPPHQYSDPKVSPDGRRVAVHVFEGGRDNWVLDLRSGAFMRLTFDPGEDETPVWSADGRWIYWSSTRGSVQRAVYRKASDGSGAEQLVWSGEPHLHIGGVTPDGSTLVVSVIRQPHVHLGTIDVATGAYKALLTTPFTNTTPALSPDGRWLAYTSDESGRTEVYVQPFPSMQGRTQVSAGGGSEPVWSRNGRELYFRGGEKVMSVAVSTAGAFSVGAPSALFDDRLTNAQGGGHVGYDTTPDGKLVLVARSAAGEAAVTHLRVLVRP